ncbi:TIGR04211 family SH3 domain-containing protein [Sedimenticola hydrogenitrophicus]|uniref:TIGR04211 family SH3 domain-containing protein n=1 Tax=Sedimenticola hydrogenitrophicus TaxID=2967975 RepID=UPI0021A6E230|nr:TIGR04211 family SH3 domain-containing protein [Sedimenticola hydrogenitrophicus]
MRGKRWQGRSLGLLLGIALAGTALVGTAQGARITDKLLAGLYAEPDSAGQPTRVLPSDTPLERLEQQGDFTKVRLGDGSEGWVESRFITDEKPARVMLLELQAKNSQLQQQLRAAERQLKARGEDADAAADPEVSTLKQQLTDLRAENTLLKREQSTGDDPRAERAILTRRVAELEQQLAEAVATTDTNPELEALQQANRQLQQRLEQIARLAGVPETTPPASETLLGRFQVWELPLLLLAMLFSFIGGVAFKNYRLAKRYGGFRI